MISPPETRCSAPSGRGANTRGVSPVRSRAGQQLRRDLDRHHSWTGRRADQREARLVEYEGLPPVEHDVARIVRLSDPDRAFEAFDGAPLAVVDIEQLAGVQANRPIGKTSCHIARSLHECGA